MTPARNSSTPNETESRRVGLSEPRTPIFLMLRSAVRAVRRVSSIPSFRVIVGWREVLPAQLRCDLRGRSHFPNEEMMVPYWNQAKPCVVRCQHGNVHNSCHGLRVSPE